MLNAFYSLIKTGTLPREHKMAIAIYSFFNHNTDFKNYLSTCEQETISNYLSDLAKCYNLEE